MSLPKQSATIDVVYPTVPRTVEMLFNNCIQLVHSFVIPNHMLLHRVSRSCAQLTGATGSMAGESMPGFGVPKKDSQLARIIIIDRRPQNSREMSVREAVLQLFKKGEVLAIG
eukprot:183213-Amphidinium_carterae.6